MFKGFTILKTAALAAVILASLILLAQLLGTGMLNRPGVREEITRRLAAQFSAEVRFTRLEATLLPRPRLTVWQPQISRDRSLDVRAERVRIYPRLVPLLTGRLEPAAIELQHPDYRLALPEVPAAAAEEPAPVPLDIRRLSTRILQLLDQLSFTDLPGVDLHVRGGRVRLTGPAGEGFELRHIQGRYARRQERLEFDFECMSNVFEQIDIQGWLAPESFTGVARIELADLQPQVLMGYLFPQSALQVARAQLSVVIDLDARGVDRMRAQVNAAAPVLEAVRGERRYEFRGQRLQAELAVDDQALALRVRDLSAAAPRMNAGGEITVAADGGVSLSIEGLGVDAAGIREAALTVLGGVKSVAEVFEVIRAGEVPQIQVRAEAASMAGLGALERWRIDGRMQAGRLRIAPLDFDLTAVNGECRIARGVLEGKGLSANLGASRGSGGRLELDLRRTSRFDLEIDVQADLARLPAVLSRVIEDRAVLAELERLDPVTGSARGRLEVAGGEDARLKAEAELTELSVGYERLPQPVTFRGGRVRLDGDGLALSGVNATAGDVRVTGAGGRIDWGAGTAVDLTAAGLAVPAADLPAWAAALKVGYPQRALAGLDGTMALEAVRFGYRKTAGNRVSLSGVLATAELSSPRLPAPLTLSGGRLRYQGERLELTGAGVRMGRSGAGALTAAVSGGLHGRLELSAEAASLDLAELVPWLSETAVGRGPLGDIASAAGTLELAGVRMGGPLEMPAAWRWEAAGRLAQGRIVSRRLGDPLEIAAADVTARGAPEGRQNAARIRIGAARVVWGPTHLGIAGDVGISADGLQVGLQVTADQLSWSQLQHPDGGDDQRPPAGKPLKVGGKIAVRTEAFHHGSFAWQPVIGTLHLSGADTRLEIQRAALCGVEMTGRVETAGGRVRLDLSPAAENQPLQPAVSCFSRQREVATGRFDLGGRLTADAPGAELHRSINGELELTAAEGRIHRLGVLAKIFGVLNLTEIYRGQLPDLGGEGFAYDTLRISAEVRDSRLELRRCAVEAPSMGLACEGQIDLAGGEMDVVIVVAPFRTADRIVKHLPIVGGILGGKLVSIPFRAKGPIGDPAVIPLSPTAVGAGVLGILERTLKLPISILQPLFPDAKAEPPSSAPEEGQ